MTDAVHPNMSILKKLDLRNLDTCKSVIADDFVWHYFNPNLPELEGDYRGVEGLKDFLRRLGERSNGSFKVKVVDGRAVGNELVVTQVRNRMDLDDTSIEFDAVVVWRIVSGKIAEGWDIPAVNTIQTVQKSYSS